MDMTMTNTIPASLASFDTLWDYNEPASTEVKFRELLPEAALLDDPSIHLQLLTQIARTHSLRRQFDEAHAILDEVKLQFDNAAPIVQIRYLLERGRTFNSAGKLDQAEPLFVNALEIGNASGEDVLAIDAAHMLAIVSKGDASLKWNEIAIQMAEKSSNPKSKKWLGSLYNNTGWSYHDLNRFNDALGMFEKALTWHLEYGSNQTQRIAKWAIARCLRSLGKTQKSLDMQLELYELGQAENRTDGYVYEEIGECYLILGKPDKATPFFAIAYQELSQDGWLVSNEPDRLSRLKELGNVEAQTDNQ